MDMRGIVNWTGIPVAILVNSSTPARIMGRGRLDEAALSIDTTRECWAEPEMHRLRAQLLLSINKYTAAEVSYRHALSLAHPWKDQGKRAEARDLLAQIYGCFNEGFDAPPARRQATGRPVGVSARAKREAVTDW